LIARRSAGYAHLLSVRGMSPLTNYLRSVGAIPVPASVPRTAVADLLNAFERFLRDERGLAAGTVRNYLSAANLFLRECSGGDVVRLKNLTSADVLRFVSQLGRHHHASDVACGLRAFLRYCHVEGLTADPLVDSIPSVARWRLSSLPKGLGAEDVRSMLEGCDRARGVGARDFAIVTLLVRLGLRAGEVAALELRDIDWRRAEVVVRGKGPRREILPLPADVGEAVAHWLAHGRPVAEDPHVFLSDHAPRNPLTSGAISQVVRRACARAGLVKVGAHRLRHSAASEMLRAGASLSDIGQVLRHRDLLTTAIYAKVDDHALRAVAQPWPSAS
jgi:integrase/recombinase XerD